MEISCCPETSRDANWVNRHYRIKVLFNAAEIVFLCRIVPKLNEGSVIMWNVMIVRLSGLFLYMPDISAVYPA